MWRPTMIQFRKWLILSHRYLGIVLSLLFVMWFVSGIAMIFSRGMPELTRDMRMERLTGLNMGAVKLKDPEALATAELDSVPRRAVRPIPIYCRANASSCSVAVTLSY